MFISFPRSDPVDQFVDEPVEVELSSLNVQSETGPKRRTPTQKKGIKMVAGDFPSPLFPPPQERYNQSALDTSRQKRPSNQRPMSYRRMPLDPPAPPKSSASLT